MTDLRIWPCEWCGSEGRVYRGSGPHPIDYGRCEACEGTGLEIIETEPIEIGDLPTLSALERNAADKSGGSQS